MQSAVRTDSPTPSNGPGSWLRKSWESNRELTVLGVAMLVVLLAAIVGIFVDHQIITGVPAWVKPAKFAISISIYSFTLVYLLSFIEGHRRLVRVVSVGTAIVMVLEMVIISAQVIRGTTSHFNGETPLDSILFNVMGAGIMSAFVLAIITVVLLLRQKFLDPAWAWALRLGLFLTVVGMAYAGFMLVPTSTELDQAQATGHLEHSGAHSVGVADGGPGLPFLGWSTTGGDLRIPHFVGLHGVQFMLIIGWLVTSRLTWLSVRQRVALIWTAGLSYLALSLILLWQALRAQPITAPDGLTLGAVGALVVATIVAVAVILTRLGDATQAAKA